MCIWQKVKVRLGHSYLLLIVENAFDTHLPDQWFIPTILMARLQTP